MSVLHDHLWLYFPSPSFHMGDLICLTNLMSFFRCRYTGLPLIYHKSCQAATIANAQSDALYNRREIMKHILIFSLTAQTPSLIKAIIVNCQREVCPLSM